MCKARSLYQGIRKRMQGRLNGGCKGAIDSMTVRDEGVVGHQFFTKMHQAARLVTDVGEIVFRRPQPVLQLLDDRPLSRLQTETVIRGR
jgi:hypothetical protein